MESLKHTGVDKKTRPSPSKVEVFLNPAKKQELMQARLRARAAWLENQQQKISDLNEALSRANAKQTEYEQEIADLKSQLQDIQSDRKTGGAAKDAVEKSTRAQICKLRLDNGKLQAEIDARRAEAKKLTAERESLRFIHREKNQLLCDRITELEQQGRDLHADNEQLQAANSDLESRNKTLQGQLADRDNQLREMQARLDTFEGNAAKKQKCSKEEIEGLQLKLKNKKYELQRLASENDELAASLREQSQSSSDVITALARERDTAVGELEKTKAAVSHQQAKLHKQLGKLTDRLKSKDEQTAELKEQVKKTEAEYESVQAELEKTIDQLRADLQRKDRKIANAEAEFEERFLAKLEIIQSLQEELNELKQKLVSQGKCGQALEVQLEETLRELGEKKDECRLLTEDAAASEAETTECKLKLDELERVLASRAEQIANIESKFADGDQRCRQIGSSLEACQEMLEFLSEMVPFAMRIVDLGSAKTAWVGSHIGLILGYSSTEVKCMGPEIMDHLIHPQDDHLLDRPLCEIDWSQKHAKLTRSCRLKSADGAWRSFIELVKVFSRNPDGSPAQLLGIHIERARR